MYSSIARQSKGINGANLLLLLSNTCKSKLFWIYPVIQCRKSSFSERYTFFAVYVSGWLFSSFSFRSSHSLTCLLLFVSLRSPQFGIHFEMVWLLWTHIFLCHDRARKIMQTHKYKFILYISMQTHRVIRKCRIFILIGKFCVLFHWRFGLRYCVFSFIRWISSNITLDTFYDHAIFGITFLFELEMESLSGSGASNVPPMVANESSGNAKATKKQRIEDFFSQIMVQFNL